MIASVMTGWSDYLLVGLALIGLSFLLEGLHNRD